MIPAEEFRQFTEAVYGRLEIGAREYGDMSFRRDPDELAGEISEELLDICGWGFILWSRLQEVRKRIKTCCRIPREDDQA